MVIKKLLLGLLCCIVVQSFAQSEMEYSQTDYAAFYKAGFGGWSVSEDLFNFIRTVLPAGKTLLEFGSGWSSGQFSLLYTVYSVEHNKDWVGKYQTNYIYAPINNGWYDIDCVKNGLPKSYDCILIDGPTGNIGRYGFLENIDLFNTDVILIFDDVNRDLELKLLKDTAVRLGRSYKIYNDRSGKQFGVIKGQ